MSAGSYVRFGVGLILSLTVLVSYIARENTSVISVLLAVIFLILAAMCTIFKF